MHALYSNGIIPRNAAALLKYLHNRIKDPHSDDIEPGLWSLIEESYNPSKNVVGYFLQVNGMRGKVNRQFNIDKWTNDEKLEYVSQISDNSFISETFCCF